MEKRVVCKPKQNRFTKQRNRIQNDSFSTFFKNRAIKLSTKNNPALRLNKHVLNQQSNKTKPIRKKPVKILINQLNSFKMNNIIKSQLKTIPYNYTLPKAIGKFPRQVINILYRLKATNYNPYINTLQYTYKNPQIPQKQRIRQLCFIGLSKGVIKKQGYGNNPTYSRTNILTRTYMLGIMKQQMQKKQQDNQKTVFVPIQQTALSFNYNYYPSKLIGVISQPAYQNTIKHINKIIQKQYIKYKKGSSINKIQLTKSEVGTFLITAIIFVILLMTKNVFLAYAIPLVVLLGFILSAIQCKNKLNTFHATKDVYQSIIKQLTDYFVSINTPFLQFKVGKDFYWLQINYKLRKSPYSIQDNDKPKKRKPLRKLKSKDGFKQYEQD